MKHRAARLAARRDLLVARSAYLRSDLQYEALQVGRRLDLVDRAVGFAQSAGGRVLLAGTVVVLLLTGPRKVIRVVGRLVAVWPVVQPWLRLTR